MARPKKRNSRKKRKDSPWWQWLLIALIAFGLYKVLDHYLPEDRAPAPPQKKSVAQPENKTDSQKALETSAAGPIKKFSFEEAQKLLPKEAYPDNVQPTELQPTQGALLAYAKTVDGKTPGPQGQKNTHPGLRWVHWDGKEYEPRDLNFKDLETALGGVSADQMEGMPHLAEHPFHESGADIYPTRIFLKDDNHEIMAYLKVDDSGTSWAPLKHASGKKMPAAFVLGTTAENSRKIRHRKQAGRQYIIIENGTLNEFKAYEGYQWTAQAYYWDKDHFAYDPDYSKKLTEAMGKP